MASLHYWDPQPAHERANCGTAWPRPAGQSEKGFPMCGIAAACQVEQAIVFAVPSGSCRFTLEPPWRVAARLPQQAGSIDWDGR